MSIKDKIKGCIILSSYLDTLGFNNGKWEFNYGSKILSNLKESAVVNMFIIHEFFALGGFSKINVSNMNASDDTIMMMANGLALLRGGKESDFIDEYLKVYDKLKEPKRGSGFGTLNSLELLRTNRSIKKIPYNDNMGGNGAAMRSGIIGVLGYDDNYENLIKLSILSSRLTHNFSLGFLGGLAVTIFTNFGMKNIPFLEWFNEFFKLEDKIDNYMKTTNIYSEYLSDKEYFFDKMKEYNERRIKSFKYKNTKQEFSMFQDRYEALETYNKYGKNYEDYSRFGASGLSSLIVAYDSLLMSHNSNESPLDLNNLDVSLDSLIFYSTLHFGDNDTTGSIAGMFYGSIYGLKGFDVNKINQLEFSFQMNQLIERIEKKLK